MARFAARVDANQAQIVSALEAAGATVQSLASLGAGCPDLLAGFQGRDFLLEVKNPKQAPNKRKLTVPQAKWHIGWRGTVHVVLTPDDALRVIGAIA